MAQSDERQFSEAVKDFKSSQKDLKRTLRDQQITSTNITKEVARVVKDDVAQLGKDIGDFATDIAKTVPGLRSVAGIAGALGKGVFGDIALKRQEKLLASQLGMSVDEVQRMRERKELNDSTKAAAEKLEKAAEELGMSSAEYKAQYAKGTEQASAQLELIQQQKEATEKQLETAKEIGADQAQILAIEKRLKDEEAKELEAKKTLFKLEEDKINGVTDEFAMATQSIIESVAGMGQDDQSGARAKEESNERKRESAATQKLLEGINKGIAGLGDVFTAALDGLADKGGFGLGVIAALIAAPVIALVSFFKQLAVEFKFIKDLASGGALAKVFAPLKRVIDFFKILGAETKAFLNFKFPKVMNFTPVRLFVEGIGKYFKTLGDIAKGTGNILKSAIGPITKGITYVKDLFSKVVAPISKVMEGIGKTAAGAGRMAKFASSFLQGLQPVLKFASTFGKILGKVFFPITIIMGIFDFFSAATEEYQDSGSILNALTAGIGGAIGGFFGMLLDLPKSIISWLFEAFLGEGNIISTALDSFSFTDVIKNIVDYGLRIILAPITFVKNLIANLFGGVMDVFGGFFDILYGIFTLDFGMIWSGITGMLGGIWDIITAPFTSIFETIGSIFDFDWWGMIKSIPGVGWLLSWFGGDEEEEEDNKEAMKQKEELAKNAKKKREITEAAVEQDNVYINGQKANEEEKAAMLEQAQLKEQKALQDYADAKAKYEESIMSNTLPEYLGDAGSLAMEGFNNMLGGISDWWSGTDESEIDAIEAERQKALEKELETQRSFGEFSEEEKAQRLSAINERFDKQIAEEDAKGDGFLSGVTNWFSTAGGLLPSTEDLENMSEEEKAAYKEQLEKMQNPLAGIAEKASSWFSSWWSGDEEEAPSPDTSIVATSDNIRGNAIAEMRTARLNELQSDIADSGGEAQAPVIVDNSVRNNNTSNNAPLPIPKHSRNPDFDAVGMSYATF